LLAGGVAEVSDAGGQQPGERGIELRVAHQERVVVWFERLLLEVVKRGPVAQGDRREPGLA
jgi:hypothetical protein